ncbi:AAA-ATPase [Thermodesulfatator indicus DSM 15286]|uniref:AAA-ATPase n=1 Tax=Thermodesulfatator indicus (strain DSM 15286 / JCM 11887 / CIR29812) TaxID=667014 RepID=F8AAQ1_THEID|nr:ATP-binding protein [Thermodesulfatator indicus]AEH44325.1 AAA-ATPase [Thermodesulfatator indicus DSM 15286]
MKRLPVGIQSFENIRTENYYYVDKTQFVKKLVDEGKYYFLSRPRRFGKSLFLDTLRQAFLAKKELFQGLYLENNWDWAIKYPVIYISFGSGVHRSVQELQETENVILKKHEEKYQIQSDFSSIKDRFADIIEKIYQKYGQKVVVLIDEYDKPILDNINKIEIATEIREELKNFYSVLKDADPFLKFVFITGVTKFSKVSLFSGLNNLEDITISPSFAAICGYTQKEFEIVFADRLDGVDLDEVRRWYNGYSWLGEPVYNPFDILLFLRDKIFRPYWFETGTPSFLIKLIIEKRLSVPAFENLELGDEIIESFDVDRIYPESLLFQTGYLTIKEVKKRRAILKYRLGWPNLEVKVSFNNYLLNTFLDLIEKEKNLDRVYEALEKNDIEGLKEAFRAFFASIPHDWYRKTELHHYEGFYASVFYAYFAALGVEVRVEDATSHGRLDMAVLFDGICYLFEFKVVELEGESKALSQLKAKKYHEKYLGRCQKVYLIGVEFSKKERNIVGFEWEEVSS